MDINWYGLSCFRIREGGVTVVCDPYSKSVGLTLPKLKADIVTISHDQPGHNNLERLTGDYKAITGPGEYEVQNVFVTGATTYHRKQAGAEPERNTVFFYEFGNLIVGHLGDLGEVPSQAEIDGLNLSEVDVLMVPVGGGDTLDPTRAVDVIGMLEPRIVIPMHYAHDRLASGIASDLASVDKFLKELGVVVPEPVDTLKLNKSNLPEETEVVLLNVSA
ncbi:MAG: MBL fold metallo-hydrolase [Caldilineaceae bacterium]|nr:MBL fold metallo-hydrolase [Caldilineaceae bacterium]